MRITPSKGRSLNQCSNVTRKWLPSLKNWVDSFVQMKKRRTSFRSPDDRSRAGANVPVFTDPGEELFSSLLEEDERTPPNIFSDLSTVLLSMDLGERWEGGREGERGGRGKKGEGKEMSGRGKREREKKDENCQNLENYFKSGDKKQGRRED